MSCLRKRNIPMNSIEEFYCCSAPPSVNIKEAVFSEKEA